MTVLHGTNPEHLSDSHLSLQSARVPDRIDETVPGIARLGTGEPPITGTGDDTVQQGADAYVGSAREFCRTIDEELAVDPYWLLPNPEPVRKFCAEKSR